MQLSYRELDAIAGKMPVIESSKVESLVVLALDKDGNILAAKRANAWLKREAGTNKQGKKYPAAVFQQVGSNFGGEPLFATPQGRQCSVSGKIQISANKPSTISSKAAVNPDDAFDE
jgi:hypothetical protein